MRRRSRRRTGSRRAARFGAAGHVAGSLLLALIFSFGFSAGEAAPVSEYELKSEILERLCRFVDWPAPDPPESVPFVIGVLGNDPFGKLLDRLAAGRKIKGRTIQVRRAARIEELGESALLFVSASEKKNVGKIVAALQGKPVLTVGDTVGFAEQGVIVNLLTQGDQVRFEINEGEAGRRGLKISSKVLRLAKLVGQEAQR